MLPRFASHCTVAFVFGLSGCSLARGTLSGSQDGGHDAAAFDAPLPGDDAGTDAAPLPDAGDDVGVDGGSDGGSDGGITPPTVPGTTLWLDERGQMSTGGVILAWADQSPGGANSMMAAGPLLTHPSAGTVGGWPAPTFDGTDDYFQISTNWDTVFGNSGGHLWLVIDNTGAVPGADNAAEAWREPGIISEATSGGIQLGWSVSGPRAYGYNGTTCSTPRIPATVGLHLLELGYDAGILSLRLDAGAPVSVMCVGPLNLFGTVGFLGRNYDGTQFFAGRIVTVIGTNTVPSAGDVDAVRTYLAARYGVSVS